MECYEIGSVVRSARIRHGMTQEDLAFGICAVSTLSKIERGICSPKIGTFEALMERMGELPGRCILLVGEQELQRQRIQEEIALAIRLGNRMHLVQQLELYRELSGDNNRQEQQWLSLGETVLHWWSGGEAVNIEQVLQRILEMSGMPLADEDSGCQAVGSYTACEILIRQLLVACRSGLREFDGDILQLRRLLEYLTAADLNLRWQTLCSSSSMLRPTSPDRSYPSMEDICNYIKRNRRISHDRRMWKNSPILLLHYFSF